MALGLEIDEDIVFQNRSWTAQRVGWVALALVIVAGLMGLFGSGPVSNTSAGSRETVWVEYERFVRYQAPTTLRIRTRPQNDAAHVNVSREYLEKVKVEKILPEPARVSAGNGFVTYRFDVSGPGEFSVKFDLITQALGELPGTVAANDKSGVSFRQFVYP
jgi:hypothetical protein